MQVGLWRNAWRKFRHRSAADLRGTPINGGCEGTQERYRHHKSRSEETGQSLRRRTIRAASIWKRLTRIRAPLSASLPPSFSLSPARALFFSLHFEDLERRGLILTRNARQLSRASRSSAKQSDAAFTDPSIWQSRLSRERVLDSALSPSFSFSLSPRV